MPRQEMKLIDEQAIPGKVHRKTEQWLNQLKDIPAGKAWAVTEDDLGVTPTSLKITVRRLVEKKLLPKTYRVMQRTVNGKLILYVVNSAEHE